MKSYDINIFWCTKLKSNYIFPQFHFSQFKKPPPKIPYKAIALAIFLFLIGSLLIIFGALLLAEIIPVEVSLVSVFNICSKKIYIDGAFTPKIILL